MNPISRPPSPEAIALRAYTLWEQSGRPVGLEAVHWQQAESELRREQELTSAAGVISTAALAMPAETAARGNRSAISAVKVGRNPSGVGTASTT